MIEITRRTSALITYEKKVGEPLLPDRRGHFLDGVGSRLLSLPRPFPPPLSFLRRFLSPLPRDLPEPLDPADEERGRNWLLRRLCDRSRDPERPRDPPAEPFELAFELALEELRELG